VAAAFAKNEPQRKPTMMPYDSEYFTKRYIQQMMLQLSALRNIPEEIRFLGRIRMIQQGTIS